MGFPGGSDGKESTCNVGDLGSTPGLERSPGGGHSNPLQYSCLERSLEGYSPWGHKESYMTDRLSTHLTRWTFVGKVISLLFNTLSRFVIAFLPRNKSFNFMVAVIISSDFGAEENKKSLTVFIVSPSICHKWWDRMPWSLFFECWVLSQLFHSPLSLTSWGSSVPLHRWTLDFKVKAPCPSVCLEGSEGLRILFKKKISNLSIK